MLRKLFGGIRMTWPRLILFAVISGLVTGLIALLVPEGNSFRQIAVTFEAWIVLAIIVVVNCDKPLDAACKTFVYFLISQPLVYLVQVPFNRMGFGLFGYYYPYWFYWTIATFPGAYIAWYIKKDNAAAAVILSVALAGLILFGCGYLRDFLSRPPRYLIAALFCFGSVPLLILCILHEKTPRIIATAFAVLALAVFLAYYFLSGAGIRAYSSSFGLDGNRFPVTSEWTVRLEEPNSGTVSLDVSNDKMFGSMIHVTVNDPANPSDILLTDPEGKEYRFPARIQTEANGDITVIYDDPE